MSTRSILGSVNNSTSLSLVNGTVDIVANSLSSTSLFSNTTVKTDSTGAIISADLNKIDIKDLGETLSNPLTENLDADGKDILNVGNLEAALINNRGVLYNPSVANLSMANFNINNVNNLNTQTINSKIPMYNPAVADLDMKNFNIINEPTIVQLQNKTINIGVNQFNETTFGTSINLAGNAINDTSIISFANGSVIDGVSTADLSIQIPGAGRILSDSVLETSADIKATNITAFGIINGQILGVGVAQAGQPGYNFPLSRPLTAGQVMVTPASTGNTLSFRSANLDGILNQTSINGISTTFSHAVILGSPTYQMPTARGTNNQYIKTNGTGVLSFASFPTPTYGQIGRQLLETVGYSLTANVFRSATDLGGTMDTTFPNSSNITPDSANGTLTYTELATKVLVVELDLRARIADGKNASGLLTLNLISGTNTIIAYDIARVFNNTARTHLSCRVVQPFATGTSFSFSIGYDSNLTTDLFLSSISLSVYGAGF
jgi:hypothetical protein